MRDLLMNRKHKQAFQELRQWCEKYQAEITAGNTINSDGYYCTLIRLGFEYYIIEDFSYLKTRLKDYNGQEVNFMEQEDDNTEE